jgi:hypothetical protein
MPLRFDAPFYWNFFLRNSNCFTFFRRISRYSNRVRHSVNGARIRHFSSLSLGRRKAQDVDEALESPRNAVGPPQSRSLRNDTMAADEDLALDGALGRGMIRRGARWTEARRTF